MEKLEQSQLGNELPTMPMPTNEPQDERQLTFGEKLVGITFNPSGDAKVNRAKELCAELADLISQDHLSRETSQLHNTLYNNTICEILNAQMNVVKVLTFKY